MTFHEGKNQREIRQTCPEFCLFSGTSTFPAVCHDLFLACHGRALDLFPISCPGLDLDRAPCLDRADLDLDPFYLDDDRGRGLDLGHDRVYLSCLCFSKNRRHPW